MSILSYFEQLTYWHWFLIGTVLLAAEALGVGGFLIGAGAAAFVQGIISLLFPSLSWHINLLSFAVLSLAFSYVYLKHFRHVNEKTDNPEINDRAAQAVGKTAIVVKDFKNGKGKVQIGDVMWDATADTDLAVGNSVTVTAAAGMILSVK